MSRVEEYRQKRHLKRKYAAAFILFLFIITAGICMSDYSFNSIMNNEKHLELIRFTKESGSYLEINLMNKKLFVNIKYISQDFQKIKNDAEKILGK